MKKKILKVAVCAALAGLLAPPALAQQKTVKQCRAEWAADRAAIAAAGKTQRVFVAECRGVPITVAPRDFELGKGQYATEAEAKSQCPTETVVWVNPRTKVYHGNGSRSYGRTKAGAYMCEKESAAAGFRAPKGALKAARDAST